MDDRGDHDWDPIPEVNPFFRGLAVALMAMAILFCLIGIAVTGTSLILMVLT